MEDKSPVFIVASVRSGSTMLRLMLDHHPAIANPGEFDFLFDHVQDNGTKPGSSDYATALRLNRVYQNKRLALDTTLSYSEIMQSFISQLERPDKTLTMNVHRNFHRIPFVFPKARYIHLLRDPRDVGRSCVAQGWAGHVYHGVDIWKAAEDSWSRLKQKLEAEQYMEIKYEDLLEDVEGGLTQICEFLGLIYSEEMLSYTKSSSFALPDNKLCYQWRIKLNTSELQLVEGKIGKEIIKCGYTLSDNEPPDSELLGTLRAEYLEQGKERSLAGKKIWC